MRIEQLDKELTCSSKPSAVALMVATSFSQRTALEAAVAVSVARDCIFFLIESMAVNWRGWWRC